MRLPGMVSDRHPDQAIYLDPELTGPNVWARWVPHIVGRSRQSRRRRSRFHRKARGIPAGRRPRILDTRPRASADARSRPRG